MAVTQQNYTGNGSTTNYSFTFPYLAETDVGVKINKVTQATTTYSFANATTISMNTAPANGAAIIIFRNTNNDAKKATFYPGSAIKAEDLNNDFDQILYTAQEVDNNAIVTLGGNAMQVDLDVGNNKIVNVATPTATTDGTNKTYVDTTIDTKIDTALTTDVVGGQSITITDNSPGSGQITASVTAGSIRGTELAADAVNGSKIADDSIDSEHIVADAIDTEHYAPNSVDAAALAHTSVTAGTYSATDLTVDDQGRITAASSGTISTSEIGADAVTNAKIADNQIDSEHYVDGSIDHVHLSNDCIDGDNIQDDVVNSEHIVAGALDNEHYASGSITSDKLSDATVIVNSEQASATVNDTSFFTSSASDARYFNISSGDTIKDGVAFPDNDTTIATTAAINDRIIDLVDDVGGFVPIANETSFPNANPDVNNGAGTLVSIKALSSNITSNGSGVATIANGTVGNSTVTITGLANSTTYASTFGMIVETTSTLNTYTFHRQVPKATEVTTVATNITNVNACGNNTTNINAAVSNASNINSAVSNASNINTVAGSISNVNTVGSNISDVNNFADLYQIATSAPSTDGGGNSLAAGDMWFDSSSNKTLKVHNGSSFQSVSPTQSVLNDISIVSGQITYLEDLGSIADATQTGTGNNINTVASNIANVNTVAGSISNVNTVAGINGNVTSVANNTSNINSAVSNATNINSAVSNASNITTVAGSISNVNTAAGSISNVNTVASSIADVNRYANEYKIASSSPSSPSAGDLWYDSANALLKYHNGSSFIGIESGITDVINDTTPELGGHLDCNDKNLTEVGTVSGNNLQIDFGTL